ncbi:transposase [Peptostreptococcaceae bacterium AGR-M142]
MSNFCITFKLNTEQYQEDILNKRFEIGRKIYNSLVNITKKRYKEMIKTKRYRTIKSELKALYGTTDKTKIKRQKELYKELNQIYKDYRLNEYSFHADVRDMQRFFKKNIDSNTSQKIATYLWKAYEKLLFGDGKQIHYKKYDTLKSLEGKSNKSGIRFKNDTLFWNGLTIQVQINYNNPYEYQAMRCKIKYCKVVRKFVKGRYKFYLQLVLKGVPPTKVNKDTGELKRQVGSGDVGLDIGTQTIAISSKSDVKLYELANRVQNIENEKNKIQRYMDRSKRATNPNNFNKNGTIKCGVKLKWMFSNKYLKARYKIKELHQKQADIRKLQHEILANEIISLGDNIYVETMNFKGLQKRAKETTVSEKGKINRKKRFGKSLANKAPSMLLTIIDRKLKYHGLSLIKIDTYKVKASSYNHIDQSYNKKKLSQRWNYFKDIKLQRDLYSAFLIMNVNSDLISIDNDKCNTTFDNFYKLHNIEIERLSKLNNLSSIGI